MNTSDYIKNCLEEWGFMPYGYYIDEQGGFNFNMQKQDCIVMMHITILPTEKTITTIAQMGYRIPEEKIQPILDYLKQEAANDGYDVKITIITDNGKLYGESECNIQENMNMDFFKNTILQPAHCIARYIPDILRIILAPDKKEYNPITNN